VHLATVVVVSNAIVLLAHDSAHRSLGVSLSPWQLAFVYSVIVPGPILALLLMRRNARYGDALLLVTMLGSLLFGVYHHYVAISPDHVAHLPPGGSQPLFRTTAALMACIQAAGVVVAGVSLGRRGGAKPLSPA
jgi:hypothetical protein